MTKANKEQEGSNKPACRGSVEVSKDVDNLLSLLDTYQEINQRKFLNTYSFIKRLGQSLVLTQLVMFVTWLIAMLTILYIALIK